MASTTVTPAQVKDCPISPGLKAAFAAVADADVQTFIDNCASWWGSAEVLQHTQREEAVKLGAAHLLYLQLLDEGEIPGGGGGGGPLSSVKLDGTGSKSWAVQAWQPGQLTDWLLRFSPFLTKLRGILDTFPPSVSTTSWPPGGPTAAGVC